MQHSTFRETCGSPGQSAKQRTSVCTEQYQIYVAIRGRNMANEQDHTEKDPYFCQRMDKVSNKDVWERTNQVKIEIAII